MKPNPIVTVFRKELKDVLRDRRTLIFMLLMPTVAIPLLMLIMTEVMTHFGEKMAREKSEVLIINSEEAPGLKKLLERQTSLFVQAQKVLRLLESRGFTQDELSMTKGDPEAFKRLAAKKGIELDEMVGQLRDVLGTPDGDLSGMQLVSQAFKPNIVLTTKLDAALGDVTDPGSKEKVLLEAIRTNAISAAVELEEKTEERISDLGSAKIKIYYLDTSERSSLAQKSLISMFRSAGREIVERRIADKKLPVTFASPFEVTGKQLPGPGVIEKILSMILPYLILVFAFLGAMYPAIDLGAGEKERGTLETLLVAPVSRFSIVVGKYLVVLTAALVSATLATLSLAVSFHVGIFSAISMLSVGSFSFSSGEAVVAMLMVLPVGCIFAALLLTLSIFAKSFKEGQSYAAPMQFVLVLPAFVSFIPGIELDWITSSIPVVNVSLALREIFIGNLDQHAIHLIGIFGSTSLVAGLLIWVAVRWFQREQVLFRN